MLDAPIFKIISETARSEQAEVYVIGGYVRDHFLKKSSKDIDFVINGDGIAFAEKLAQRLTNGKLTVYKNFGTALLKYEDMELEFVGARKESYRKTSRKPVVVAGTLADDLRRRDFTINTLAFDLSEKNYGQFIDPFSGLEDLKNKVIRTPTDPAKTFSDDPLRMLRAIRFATVLDFNIESSCEQAIKKLHHRIEIISAERIATELNKIISAAKPSKGFKLLDECDLLQYFLPELIKLKGSQIKEGQGHKDNFFHSLQVLDNVSEVSSNLWLRWGALLHDIGKAPSKRYDPEQGWTFHGHDYIGSKMVKGIFKRLRLPLNEKLEYVKKLVALHLRPIALTEESITDSAVRRLLFDAGDDIDDLMILCEADITSKNKKKVEKYLQNFKMLRKKLEEVEESDRLRNWQPPVSGEMIMNTFGIPPSKTVGIIKTAIREAILDGKIANNQEEAREYMLAQGLKLGLSPGKRT